MPQNKNALIRYKTIDKCLQNKYRLWTLEDLIAACSDALYEYEGKDVAVSKRTVQLDIQTMRSEKLGYNAPIEVYDKKYYRYEDEDFSITDVPLTESDMNVLFETIAMLKQFKDFSLFDDVSDIVQRLEDKIYAEKTHTKPVIHLDKNEQLKGLEHLELLYQAIVKKIVLRISYRSFKAKNTSEFTFHGFLLKEFNNRWFLVGKKQAKGRIMHLALDRFVAIDFELKENYCATDFDPDTYYRNIVGVTLNGLQEPDTIEIWLDAKQAPYVLTKPLHHSQRVMQENEDGSVVLQLTILPNFELERLLLGFGSGLEVLKPEALRTRMTKHFSAALRRYEG